MSDSVTIALDVGGTKVAGALVDRQLAIVARAQQPTVVDGRRDPGLGVTREVAERLAGRALELGLTPDGVAGGFPEYVHPSGRLASREVLEWIDQPLDVLAHLGPVTVDSDVRCAALGEGAGGAARDLASYAFVIVGTGLSYALVERNQARAGARGEAIGLGELEVSKQVDSDTTLSLERYASGEGIRERYVEAGGLAVDGAAEVFELAAQGDGLAADTVDSAARAVGTALATVASLIDPGAFVVGGGVSASGEPWRSTLARAYLARAAGRPEPPPLRWATLGSDAGIIGAAIAHRQHLGSTAEAET